MPPFVLTVLKFVFLALLYFFVYRAIRSVVLDLRSAQPSRGREARPASAPKGTGRKAPRSLQVLDEHGGKLESRRLDGTIHVGRADACQIQLSDNYVSSFHARIFSRDGSWYVEDLGSTNGTYLNQRRITGTSELRTGDRLRIGKTTLELRR